MFIEKNIKQVLNSIKKTHFQSMMLDEVTMTYVLSVTECKVKGYVEYFGRYQNKGSSEFFVEGEG